MWLRKAKVVSRNATIPPHRRYYTYYRTKDSSNKKTTNRSLPTICSFTPIVIKKFVVGEQKNRVICDKNAQKNVCYDLTIWV